MNKLERDTQLLNRNGVYVGTLNKDWEVWSPNGGYLAAFMLRAAAQESSFEFPISMSCHFLNVGTFDDVQIRIRSLKKSRTVEVLGVSMWQRDKHLVEAIIWTGDELEGYQHNDAPMPVVPPVKNALELDRVTDKVPHHPFWKLIDQRPLDGLHWVIEESEAPVQKDWLSLRNDETTYTDPFVNAGRYAVFIDNFGWPAAGHAHVGDYRFIAPTLSLNIDFHSMYEGRWILSQASSPVAERGLIAFQNRLWSEEGNLIASGSGTLMCRPRGNL